MLGYKERAVTQSQSEVYYNLHKNCFSVKQNGVVVLHSDVVFLSDVTFHVSEKGRQRVLAEQRKNVHATVRGLFIGSDYSDAVIDSYIKDMKEAYYNPYYVSTFIDRETGEPVHESSLVLLVDKKVYYI